MDNLNDIEISGVADELGSLLDMSATQIIHTPNPDSFIRWFRTRAPDIAPNFVGQLPDDEQARRAFLYNMARMIWNKTPLPQNRFRPNQLKSRNAICPAPAVQTGNISNVVYMLNHSRMKWIVLACCCMC